VQTLPWQALFEQKELLLIPPASAVVWQLAHVASKAWRCRLIQFDVR
ncbi:MAG: hypothetical protein HW375_1853, partial [Anaerolineales bacterium]|nr:hypothetical protein [Anaerolineales bacterium]